MSAASSLPRVNVLPGPGSTGGRELDVESRYFYIPAAILYSSLQEGNEERIKRDLLGLSFLPEEGVGPERCGVVEAAGGFLCGSPSPLA